MPSLMKLKSKSPCSEGVEETFFVSKRTSNLCSFECVDHLKVARPPWEGLVKIKIFKPVKVMLSVLGAQPPSEGFGQTQKNVTIHEKHEI